MSRFDNLFGGFVRKSTAPHDKYGQILYYVDAEGFVRKSTAPHDKYGQIMYYIDNEGFVRKSTAPHDKYGQILYYVDAEGFVRKSTAPHDKYGQIMYYIDNEGFIRKSTAPHDKYGQILYYLSGSKQNEVKRNNNNEANDKKAILLLVAFVIGLIIAPIIIVLGMFGKFILGDLFKNVQPIQAFKKFRKIFSIIILSWLGTAFLTIILFICFGLSIGIPLFLLVVINIAAFILSIVIGNKIYNEHKDELPKQVELPINNNENNSSENSEENNASNVMTYDAVSNVMTNDNSKYVNNEQDDEMIVELRKYKQIYNEGLISENEYSMMKKSLFNKYGVLVKDDRKNLKDDSKTPLINLLWFFDVFNVVSILTNIILALSINGDLMGMYQYFFYGYFIAFIFITISTIMILIFTMILLNNSRAKAAIWCGVGSIIITAFLLILPLLFM